MILVTTSAVNIDTTIPSASVYAKPFTLPVPIIPSTNAATSVVTFPSIIADNAFWKPTLSADFTFLPTLNSSLTRAKIITFASTAIPIERMIPAIPGSVNVILNAFNNTITNPV